MFERLFLVGLLGALLASPALAGETEGNQASMAPSISATELHERREAKTGPVVIDVRTAGEYETGHIPGAVNIPYDQVAERIGEVEAPHGVALYCMIGPRARKGETALLAVGYQKVFHLEGGLAAWKDAGLPVEGSE
jgi:rhodanese-related sulfurtransferase